MSKDVPPFVSVIIPHYNDLANLALCIAALGAQSLPADRFEIVIADNNSAGGVAAAQAVAPGARVVPAPEQGSGPARNFAVAVARGEVLAFIDSDCVADPDWLVAGLAGLEHFDYVGGQVVTAIGEPWQLTPSEAYEAVFAFNFKKYIEVDKFTGTGNFFVPKAIFDRVGSFRAGVSPDVEWCWRANARGYRLGYAPAAIVEHKARREWRELKRKHDRMDRDMLRLYRERRGWQWRWVLYAGLVAASPFVHWLRVVQSRRLRGPRAKLLGLCGLAMLRYYRSYRMMTLLIGLGG